jgi:hypothetical protein
MQRERPAKVQGGCGDQEVGLMVERLRESGAAFLRAQTPFELRRCYRSGILFALHAAIISSGHKLAWISPTCALRKKYMQSLDCPMPPPMLSGIPLQSSF